MKSIAIIEAPSILGLRPTGVEHLPDALVESPVCSCGCMPGMQDVSMHPVQWGSLPRNRIPESAKCCRLFTPTRTARR